MMKKVIIGLLLLTSIHSTISAQSIDKSNSKVSFEISNFRVNDVEGTFTGMEGKVNFDPSDLNNSSFDVCIDAASVNTGIKKRDNHLRTSDFFYVEKYPNICFKSTSISKKGDQYITTGMLTMHGVTKTVMIPFTYSGKTFTGSLKLKRKVYNIGEDTSTFTVGDDVTITIKCVVK